MGRAAICCVIGVCLLGAVACRGEPEALALRGEGAQVGSFADASAETSILPYGFGPDPEPRSCGGDAASVSAQCGVPASVCIDGGISVDYALAGCASGSCVWDKVDRSCATLGAGGICVAGSDAGLPALADGGAWATAGACAVPIQAPLVAAIPCDEDAGDAATMCPPPPSVCQGNDILFYDEGVCVAGQCHFVLKLRTCPTAYCSGGACFYAGTSAAPFSN